MTQIVEEETLADADAAEKGPYDQFILLAVYYDEILWSFSRSTDILLGVIVSHNNRLRRN